MKATNQVVEGFELAHEIVVDVTKEVGEGTAPAFERDVVTEVEAHLEGTHGQDAVDLPAALAVEAAVADKSYVLSLHGLMNAVAEAGDEDSLIGLAEK